MQTLDDSLFISQLQALQQALASTKIGNVSSSSPSTVLPSLSYQEQAELQVIKAYQNYFRNTRQCYLQNKSSKIYQKLVNEYTLLGNSLWSYAHEVLDYINSEFQSQEQISKVQEQIKTMDIIEGDKHQKQSVTKDIKNVHNTKFIILEHLHYHSQSPLLALFSKLNGHDRVKLRGSRKQIQKGWTTCTVPLAEVDKVTAFKNLMTVENIELNLFQEEEEIENISQYKGKPEIEILDLFNVHASIYRPFLHQFMKNISSSSSTVIYPRAIIIYIHPSQSIQLSQFFPNLISTYVKTCSNIAQQQKSGLSQQLLLPAMNLSTVFPCQWSTIQSNTAFQSEIMLFLNQQMNHPTKQDIIIFHENSEEYVKHIKNLMKKNDLTKTVNIIHDKGMNSVCKQALPMPPAFLNHMLNSPIFMDAGVEKVKSTISDITLSKQGTSSTQCPPVKQKQMAMDQKPGQVQPKQQQVKINQNNNENVKVQNTKDSAILKKGSSQSPQLKSGISMTTSSLRLQPSASLRRQSHTQNSIFIVPNYQTLLSWRYDLSHVFYVFDFRTDSKFHFDYEVMSYVEVSQQFITGKEAALRIGCMGVTKIGKYCYVNPTATQNINKKVLNQEKIKQSQENIAYLDDGKIKDVGLYTLKMIHFGSFQQQKQCSQVKFCVKALLQAKIIQKQQNSYTIVRGDVYKCICRIPDLNPILCLSILNAKCGNKQQQIAPAKLAILLAMAASVMMTPGDMRLTQTGSNNSGNSRLNAIWRQTGYLHSCIDLLVRAKIIQHRQRQIAQGRKSRRSVSKRFSKQTSQQYDVFGDLFEIVVADRLTFDQMKLQDLLRQQFVNETIFSTIVESTQRICDVLGIEDFMFTSLEVADMNALVIDIAKVPCMDKTIGVFSGSRRVGYFVKNQTQGIFPNKSSLISILNQRPHFVFITRLTSSLQLTEQQHNQNNRCHPHLQILAAVSVPELVLMENLGLTLPTRRTSSYGQSQFQYHGIASATFKHMYRNDGADITAFQQKHQCFVELNQQIALISIHCSKEKQSTIKSQFQAYLNKIKQKMATQTKIVHYLGATSLLFGSGGKTIQVIKDKYINKCLLSNLDLAVQVEDLNQLFQQFFNLKSIQVTREPASCPYKTAYIQFQTQKDYYRFHQYFNECLYFNRYIRVQPIESIPTASSYKEEMCLQFIWTAWKSNCEAIIQFQNDDGFKKCYQSLTQVGFDGKKLQVIQKQGNKIYMKGLNPLTDQISLQSGLQVYGKIKHLQLLKTPTKQNLKSLQALLQDEIRKKVQGLNANEIQVKKVQKLKNGIRKCKVIYKNQQKLNNTIVQMNQKPNIMGVGRIHIKSWFVYPIKIAHGYFSLYQQLVNVVLSKMPNNRMKIQTSIFNEQQYIIGKSNLKQEIDVFKQNVNQQLQGYSVPLTGLQTNILLTEVGIRNLIDLEDKYNCRLIPDFSKKTLTVQTLFDNLKGIKQEIKAKVQDNFFYRIPLNQKSFKHFKQNPEASQTLKKQYHLTEFELQQVGRNLLLQGNANNVEKAFNYLMHVIQSVSKPTQQQMLNGDVCGICCEQPFRPYRLQQCCHKFCMNCLLDSVNTALGDVSMFPIKCPQCLVQIAMVDLNELLTTQTWLKLKNIALNQYVGRNPQIISSCYTAGCKQVNFLITNFFNCDECQQVYCTGCKLNYHPGLTCQQAKQGGNAAFEKYMKQNGIRKCPNQSCKMPIMRTDGCYRVTCSRCNKSMCFKCQPQKMIPYQHYNDCYKHLTDVHGGYW